MEVEGPIGKNGKLGQNGIRPNMVLDIFILALKFRAFRWGEREKRRRRKSRYRIHVWNISFVWNSCICKYGTYVCICWLGNHPNSFFVYVWVRKTLTLQYMCILVASSQFYGWFSFGWKISGENGHNWPFI